MFCCSAPLAFFFSSRRRHTRFDCDWSSDVCSSDLPPGPLALPARGIDPDGLVDLDGDGMALACRASTVNFALRTPDEQQALVAAFARVLHALTGPVQLVVRSERADLARLVSDLDEGAGGLPHP